MRLPSRYLDKRRSNEKNTFVLNRSYPKVLSYITIELLHCKVGLRVLYNTLMQLRHLCHVSIRMSERWEESQSFSPHSSDPVALAFDTGIAPNLAPRCSIFLLLEALAE